MQSRRLPIDVEQVTVGGRAEIGQRVAARLGGVEGELTVARRQDGRVDLVRGVTAPAVGQATRRRDPDGRAECQGRLEPSNQGAPRDARSLGWATSIP